MKLVSRILDKLSSRPYMGGLLIDDSVIQYVFLGKEKQVSFSLRLPPGIIKEGRVEKPAELLSYLKRLNSEVSGGGAGRKFDVVVSLSPAVIYTQSFNVPKIDQEKLEESVRLNLQIISPIELSQAHVGWQVIGKTEDRYDILGAFVEKSVVDKLKTILSQAGFEALIFEFPALALTRITSSSLRLPQSPVIILHISSDGLELSISKEKSLYFEYFHSWRSIQGEAREISKSAFEEVVIQEVKKVIDFSVSRFREGISQVFVIAPGFEKEIRGLLEKNFNLPAVTLTLKDYSLAPNWYAVLGSALRGKNYSGSEDEINLSGLSLKEVFYEKRLLNFIVLWRNILIGSAAIILIVFGISLALLAKESNTIIERLNDFKAQVSQSELTALQGQVREFNYLVSEIKKAKSQSQPWYQRLSRLKLLADQNSITIDGLNSGTSLKQLNLSGRAPSTAQVLRFKNVLVAEQSFTNVNLPLSGITTLGDNSVSFSMSFEVR